ncbi:glycosyltransferase [Kocuria rosea]|uniref:glycosyltransferase n=1 Tax=Kocuria rosea TaxID=1275 RepID=UPI000DF90675|nr:glycosyltransferase family A protein [Kocuria rosea]STX15475.1 N-glycosyltransferase [Kocuria rosea]
MPKYVVLMPARNAESTIESAITSTLRAFPKDSHIAVWDDASEDRTKDVAEAFHNRRVSVLATPESVGSGAARQRLLEATDSEFVVIQDADDISLPWRSRLQSRHLSAADFSFANTQRFSQRHLIHKPSLPLNYNTTDVPLALIFHNPLAHSTMIARRSALMEIGGYSDSKVAQDYEMLLRAASFGKRIVRSAVPTVLYRMSPTQISKQIDYGERIINSKVIRSSYDRNLERQLFGTDTNSRLSISMSGTIPQTTLDNVQPLIDRMSRQLRPYYRHLLQNQRLGYLPAHVLT